MVKKHQIEKTDLNKRESQLRYLWILIIAIAAVLPYLPSLGFGFTIDDNQLIVQDSFTHSLSNAAHAFTRQFILQSDNPAAYYRPIVAISYQANYAFAGPHPYTFHLTNIFLGLITALLAYVMLLKLTKDRFIAGVGSLLFAVHPTHAETNSWIAGRTDVLSCLFVIAAFIVFIANYRLRPAFSWKLAVCGSLLFMCGLFSKENAIILPVLLAAYIWTLGDGIRLKEIRKWLIVFLLPMIIYLILRKLSLGTTIYYSDTSSLGERLLTIGFMYASYLRMLFIPQEVHVLYNTIQYATSHPALAIAAWIIPLGMATLAVILRKRNSLISFSIAWILITLLPAANLIPTASHLPADRLTFLSGIGSVLICGWLIKKMWDYRPQFLSIWPAVVAVFIGWLALYCGILTVTGSQIYRSNVAWARAVAASDMPLPHYRSYAATLLLDNKLYEEAEKEYKAAIDLGANDIYDYRCLAYIYRGKGKSQDSLRLLNEAEQLHPHSASIKCDIGSTYAQMKECDSAIKAFKSAVELKPKYVAAWRNLGKAYLEIQRSSDAVSAYEHAASIAKPRLNDHLNAGLAYKGAGMAEKAKREFGFVIAHDKTGKYLDTARKALRSMQ